MEMNASTAKRKNINWPKSLAITAVAGRRCVKILLPKLKITHGIRVVTRFRLTTLFAARRWMMINGQVGVQTSVITLTAKKTA